MAWTAPKTFTDGVPLTAEDLNIHLRDNLLETEVAKSTSSGSWFIGAGPNTIVERIPQFASVSASDQCTSTSYVDLESLGPSVTVVTGSRALIMISAGISNSVNESTSFMAYAISGATTQTPSDNWSLRTDGISADKVNRRFQIFMEDDIRPGENTFTAKYKTGANPATFQDRFIAVWPF